MWTSRSRYTAVAAAILAAACGGGGDGGDGGTQPPPPPQQPTLVTISAANQDTVARASVASIMPFTSVPVLSTSPGPAGLAQLALRSVGAGYKQLPSMPPGMARPLKEYQATSACYVSGTRTVIWDDRDNNGDLSPGDFLSVSFSQCSESPGSTVNGSMGMSIATFSATTAATDFSGSMAFQSLAMVDGGVSFTLNGGVAFHLNAAQSPSGDSLSGSYTVASGGLTVVGTGGAAGYSDTFSYRGGYTVTERDFTSYVAGIPSTEELSASGDFGSQALGGDLSLTTVQPFKSVWTDPTGDIFPSQGQMVATGQGNTKLSLSATETVQVRMDMCDDGDGTWEATKMVNWDWLLQ